MFGLKIEDSESKWTINCLIVFIFILIFTVINFNTIFNGINYYRKNSQLIQIYMEETTSPAQIACSCR